MSPRLLRPGLTHIHFVSPLIIRDDESIWQTCTTHSSSSSLRCLDESPTRTSAGNELSSRQAVG
ncbi:hypothetical protein M404DRAFT_672219 [Pisolithus tinctorius Marx 270]|uniref:Uncharacterized protein n=1 Tax=Pisolithus tinctorius Marx 270 TaxID=870435 RepID=A0A0C3NAB9_PISTI|nr:hypothetical protein M404DRAFT_672219 [Pisolithus tinctorius Marx 270]